MDGNLDWGVGVVEQRDEGAAVGVIGKDRDLLFADSIPVFVIVGLHQGSQELPFMEAQRT